MHAATCKNSQSNSHMIQMLSPVGLSTSSKHINSTNSTTHSFSSMFLAGLNTNTSQHGYIQPSYKQIISPVLPHKSHVNPTPSTTFFRQVDDLCSKEILPSEEQYVDQIYLVTDRGNNNKDQGFTQQQQSQHSQPRQRKQEVVKSDNIPMKTMPHHGSSKSLDQFMLARLGELQSPKRNNNQQPITLNNANNQNKFQQTVLKQTTRGLSVNNNSSTTSLLTQTNIIQSPKATITTPYSTQRVTTVDSMGGNFKGYIQSTQQQQPHTPYDFHQSSSSQVNRMPSPYVSSEQLNDRSPAGFSSQCIQDTQARNEMKVQKSSKHQKGCSWGGGEGDFQKQYLHNQMKENLRDQHCNNWNWKNKLVDTKEFYFDQQRPTFGGFSRQQTSKLTSTNAPLPNCANNTWLEKVMKQQVVVSREAPEIATNVAVDVSLIKGNYDDACREESFVEENDYGSLLLAANRVEMQKNQGGLTEELDVSKSFNLETLVNEVPVEYSKVEDVSLVLSQNDKIFERRDEESSSGGVALLIRQLKNRISALESENRDLKDIVAGFNAQVSRKELDFKKEIETITIKARERVEQLARQMEDMDISYRERVNSLTKETNSLKKQVSENTVLLNQSGEDSGKDTQKLVECLSDMIMNFGSLGCSNGAKPSVKQIWKWLKCVLNEYMRLKTTEESAAKVIERVSLMLDAKKSDEVVPRLEAIIKENSMSMRIVKAFAPYFGDAPFSNSHQIGSADPIQELERFFNAKLKRPLA